MIVALKQVVYRSRRILLYAFAMGILVFVLKWLQWKFLITDNSLEIYVGAIAVFFTTLGVWIATQLYRQKVRTVVVEKEVYVWQPNDGKVNEVELKKLNLTRREYEVLQLVTQGCSNAEIADKLFLSLSTVKTHASNLFDKMSVKTRAQAIEKANRLRITP